ncbi:nickel-dependent lactate racemase family protein [Microlunatus flavus]|uniref:Nickel-dependent lactate racemase n=1 Tax=Microlunatus flavus TaxID=1036181 RepID=A0A1H9J6W4_9ACTN|nr:nickel-dependent lactate racemase [Microlunatus flavus]SEQ82507.1 Nickel-dependent lactate racemase [Microlunatus flavus]
MTRVELAYGRGQLEVELAAPAEVTVFRKAALPPLPDPAAAVTTALMQPVGSAPLAELARDRRSACIVICDITRPVPNGLFLRPMIETLVRAGLALESITVLVATGLHRPNVGAELAELVGDAWVLEHVRVENHDARDETQLVDLGRTPTRGTPVTLARRFVEADLRIVTGLVEPHFMAGWSGGRKVVAPGVAGHRTIRTFHSYAFMADPFATQCNLVDNPLHEEQLQIVAMVGETYALNTVLDEDRRLLQVTFGEVVASHAAAVTFAEGASKVSSPRRFGTVLTSAGGYPLDKTYYQTVKSMVTPLDVLTPGGTLVVASECSEGFGSPEFADAQARLLRLGPAAFLAELGGKALADVDEWQTQMQLRSQVVGRVELFCSGLDAAQRRSTGVEPAADLAAAVAASIRRTGDPHVAVVPDGPYTVPVHVP